VGYRAKKSGNVALGQAHSTIESLFGTDLHVIVPSRSLSVQGMRDFGGEGEALTKA
jgi:hypothetical protein